MLLRLLPNWMSKDPGCGKTLLCPIRLPEIHKIRYELPLALGDQFELASPQHGVWQKTGWNTFVTT